MDDDLPLFADRGQGYQSNLTEASPLDKAMLNAAPQAALLLEYLSTGRGLSGLIAHTVLGITSLTTRIAELRKLGLPIEGTWERNHSGKRFMVYRYKAGSAGIDQPLRLEDHPIYDPSA